MATTTVLTVGGANFGINDTVGKALGGYAETRGTRRVVPYSQSWAARSMNEGLHQLDIAIREEMAASRAFEIVAVSAGAELAGVWLEENAHLAEAPAVSQLLRITLLGNVCRRFGGAMGRGFLGPRRPTPETQYPTLDIARKNDGWANADAWWPVASERPSKARLLLGRVVDHSFYDRVDPVKCLVREVVGNTRYLVAP